jgi:hypothetical protein
MFLSWFVCSLEKLLTCQLLQSLTFVIGFIYAEIWFFLLVASTWKLQCLNTPSFTTHIFLSLVKDLPVLLLNNDRGHIWRVLVGMSNLLLWNIDPVNTFYIDTYTENILLNILDCGYFMLSCRNKLIFCRIIGLGTHLLTKERLSINL